MTIERAVLILVWLFCVIIIPITVPKERVRESVLIFLVSQTISWLLSVLAVEMNLFQSPIREFPTATGSNFTNNYMLYPVSSMLFYLHYPKGKSVWIRALYQTCYLLLACVYLYAVEAYTNLYEYKWLHVTGNVIVFFISLNAIKMYGKWFFKKSQEEG